MAHSPTRVFASLGVGGVNVEEIGSEPRPGTNAGCSRCRGAPRQVEVTGSSELSVLPDRAVVTVSVTHSKESVADCSNSVARRLDYILQTLRQHSLKEEDMAVMRHVRREGDLYHAQAEVSVTFSDFQTMQAARSVLIEKLDKSVRVGDPAYSHSSESLCLLRRRACAAAVEAARLKAGEVCNLLGQALGRPLLVREEETREWRPEREEGVAPGPGACPMPVSASSRMFVRFELRPKDGARKRL